MPTPKQIKGEPLRAYINWQGRWCYVYVHGSDDQQTLTGDPVRMLYFKLTKNSRELLAAEKSKFQKKKPTVRSARKGVEA